jgi:uncharacterized protein YcbX
MLVATVTEVHRYPVKSMGGEAIVECAVGERGLVGDRAFALFDPAEGRAASAKRAAEFPRLMDFRARYGDATGDVPAELTITLPDGTTFRAGDPACRDAISAWFGRRIEIGSLADPPARRPTPGKYAMEGTFFDYAALHLLTTASMASFAAAAPESLLRRSRFRPNVVLAIDAASPYPENEWVGKTLRLGDEIVIEVTDPCPRCAMITLGHEGLPKDAGLLKVLARENVRPVPVLQNEEPSLGVYAFVKRGGTLKVGDVLRMG